MGLPPSEINHMSLWEFNMCADGFVEAHGGKKKAEAMNQDELRALGIEGA